MVIAGWAVGRDAIVLGILICGGSFQKMCDDVKSAPDFKNEMLKETLK